MLYRSSDYVINFLPCERTFGRKIIGLNNDFISRANEKWDPNAYFLILSALREIADLKIETEATNINVDKLCFSCQNKAEVNLEITLYPAIEDNQLPLIMVANGALKKIYEVAYESNMKKLYFSLKTMYIKYSQKYNCAKITRKLRNNKIIIILDKNNCRVNIKINKIKDGTQNHFIIPEEETFLKALAALNTPFNPQEIFRIFKESSGILLSEVDFQMEFFDLSVNPLTKEETQRFKGGIEIKNGEKMPYYDLADKYTHIADPDYYGLPNENKELNIKGEKKMEIFNNADQQTLIYKPFRLLLGFMPGINPEFTESANQSWYPRSKKLIYNVLRIIEPGFKITSSLADDLILKGIDKNGLETIIYLCPKGDNDLLPLVLISKQNQSKTYECGFDETSTKMALNLKSTQFIIGDLLITTSSSNNEAEVKINGSNISFDITVIDSNPINPEYNLFKVIAEALEKLNLTSDLKGGSRDILKICKAFKDSLKGLSSDFKISIVSNNSQEQIGQLSVENDEILSFEIVVDSKGTGRVLFRLNAYDGILMPKVDGGNQNAEALAQRKILANQLKEGLNNL